MVCAQHYISQDSKFEINGEQVRNGKNAMHWYSPNEFKESRVTKTVRVMKDGHYIFTGYLSGERASYVADIYVNDKWVGKDTGEVRNYEYWNKVRVEFDAKAGDNIKIEFIINGWDGSYGSIDDCSSLTGKSKNLKTCLMNFRNTSLRVIRTETEV